MKVGIYDRWLKTMGGGERYVLCVASRLARNHDVVVLTHEAVERAALEAQFNLDLAGVEIRCVPDGPQSEMMRLTGEYDIFVNGTFMSRLPSAAKRGVLLVFFPMELRSARRDRLLNAVSAVASKTLSLPQYGRGFYPPEKIGHRDFRWTGDEARVRVYLPAGRGPIDVTFIMGRMFLVGGGAGDVSIFANGEKLARFSVPSTGSEFKSYPVSVDRAGNGFVDFELHCDVTTGGGEGEGDGRRLGVAVADVRVAHPLNWPYRALSRFYPRAARRLARPRDEDPVGFVDTYQTICTISEYSRLWTKRYWRRDSVVLHPPVDVDSFSCREKQKRILSVGRFFRGGHNKKHLEMVRAFRDLVDGGLEDWELHLAGGVSSETAHRAYLEAVRSAARGYPIHLHPDIGFPDLRQLYGEASIYWHACGYGENESADPVRFEHFGITTVEAMASGCIPVVIGKAGQMETVEHGASGLLWTDIEGLKNCTLQVIHDPALAAELRAGAQARSRRFSQLAFDERLDAIFSKHVLAVER